MEFCADFKNVQKSDFLEKKISGAFLTQEFYKLLKSEQNSDSFKFLIPFAPNFKEFFFLHTYLIKVIAIFLKVRRSNKIEPFQHLNKHFLKTCLRILRQNQNHMKQSDLGKSLGPNRQTISIYQFDVKQCSGVDVLTPSISASAELTQWVLYSRSIITLRSKVNKSINFCLLVHFKVSAA